MLAGEVALEEFDVKIGLRGSVLSPLLSIIATSKEPVCPRVELILKIIIILLKVSLVNRKQ